MKIGNYNIDIIEAGNFSLDGGAMFGIIPKALWMKNNPPDPLNRITLSTRLLLLENGTRKILIDTGFGNKWDEKSKQIYCMNNIENQVESALLGKNINPDEITDVILTHFHFDHAGGSTKYLDNKIIPVFQNAKYHIQRKNFEWAMNPSDRDKGSYLKENIQPLNNEGVLNFYDGNSFFDDEIELIVINGHTFSQQLVKISDPVNTLLYCGDLFPLSSQIHLPYIMGYDLQPLITLEEKKSILKQAVEGNWILFFEHDPFLAAARVEKSEKGYKINERYMNLDD